MAFEFISLFKLGVGPILVRYDDIILMEPTPTNNTRLELSYGSHIIVVEDFICILSRIKAAKLLNEQNKNA